MSRSSFALALSSAVLLTIAGAARAQGPKPPAPQKYGDHLEVEVTGIKRATHWVMLPGMPGGPSLSAGPGETLLVVQFRVKDLTKRTEDTDASFADFELEDAAGQTHACPIGKTDLREVGFKVPEGTKAKAFRLSGLSFDVEALNPRPAKP